MNEQAMLSSRLGRRNPADALKDVEYPTRLFIYMFLSLFVFFFSRKSALDTGQSGERRVVCAACGGPVECRGVCTATGVWGVCTWGPGRARDTAARDPRERS